MIKTRKATAWNKPGIFPIKQTSLEDIDYVISKHDLDLELIKETKNKIYLYKTNKAK